MREGDWIQTYTGRQFWPLDPRPEEIFIEDIAHALSMQCRFGGHVKAFYSVAQHSVEVSNVVLRTHGLWGLLHDASEAYLVDLPRPLKHFGDLGKWYKFAESALMVAIAERFGLQWPMPTEVEMADDCVLAAEKRDLLAPEPAPWAQLPQPWPEKIKARSAATSERLFLARFRYFGGLAK